MIIRLQHQRSDGDVDTYHLKSGRRYHIGRGSACEVRILDLKLSRKHCAVEYHEGEWRVIDLASTNGCKVDGDQIVGSQALRVGTQIEIGQSTIAVVRILGEDEIDDEDEDPQRAPPQVAAVPASLHPTPATKPQLPTPPPATNGASSNSGRHVEQEKLEEDEPSGPVEHTADNWEPEPEPDASVKTGALVPNAAADAQAELALEVARRAAEKAAAPGSTGTDDLQKPPRLQTPLPKAPAPLPKQPTPRPELQQTKPPADASSSQYRKTPLPRQPTPLPMPAAEIESGPFKSLEPQPPARAAAARSEIKPPPKPTLELDEAQPTPAPPPVRQPSTETRRRLQQKVVPIIVQPMSVDEAVTAAPSPQAPAPAAPPSPAPAEAAAAAEAPKPATGEERTFYITVLGRRVGPLTRALARDLKARELKGTLALKDLDQYG